MVKEYAVGEKYYLPVRVREIMDDTYTYPVRIGFENGNGCMDGKNAVKGIPGILLTAEDIATVINTERDDALAELKARNAELEALLKEVMATRDEAIRQNDELIAENEKLKADRDEWKKVAANNASFHRDACNERDELKTANDDLKAMVNDLKDRLARFEKKNENQAEKIKGLEERISDVCAGNQQLRENRDALNNEAAVHMTSIHNLQVAVEVLAEKIFEMRCEQDG